MTYRPRDSAAFNLPSSDKEINLLDIKKLQNVMGESHKWAR